MLYTKCYYNDQIKENKTGGVCMTHSDDQKCTNILARKPKGEIIRGKKPRFRCEDIGFRTYMVCGYGSDSTGLGNEIFLLNCSQFIIY
jgi:hypothetical protein